MRSVRILHSCFGLLINDGGSFGRAAHLLDKAGESNNEAQTEERNRSQDDHAGGALADHGGLPSPSHFGFEGRAARRLRTAEISSAIVHCTFVGLGELNRSQRVGRTRRNDKGDVHGLFGKETGRCSLEEQGSSEGGLDVADLVLRDEQCGSNVGRHSRLELLQVVVHPVPETISSLQ